MGKNKKGTKNKYKARWQVFKCQREEWEWYVSLVVKDSFVVCPNAWVCRLIVQVIFVPFSAIITKPLLLVLQQLLLEGSKNITTS